MTQSIFPQEKKNYKGLIFPSPCPHCGKKNENKWCYEYIGEDGHTYGVCKRNAPAAMGWEETPWTDNEGTRKYKLIVEKSEKPIRPARKRIWEYPDRKGNSLVRVIRIDDGKGGKPKRWQEHWNGREWVKGLKGIKRADIPIYRYQEVREAIAGHRACYR